MWLVSLAGGAGGLASCGSFGYLNQWLKDEDRKLMLGIGLCRLTA